MRQTNEIATVSFCGNVLQGCLLPPDMFKFRTGYAKGTSARASHAVALRYSATVRCATDRADPLAHRITTAPPNPPPVIRAPNTSALPAAMSTRRSMSGVEISKSSRIEVWDSRKSLPSVVTSSLVSASTEASTRAFSVTTWRARRSSGAGNSAILGRSSTESARNQRTWSRAAASSHSRRRIRYSPLAWEWDTPESITPISACAESGILSACSVAASRNRACASLRARSLRLRSRCRPKVTLVRARVQPGPCDDEPFLGEARDDRSCYIGGCSLPALEGAHHTLSDEMATMLAEASPVTRVFGNGKPTSEPLGEHRDWVTQVR